MKNNHGNSSHTKWRYPYHIVLTPRDRRQKAYGKYHTEIEKISKTICDRYGVEMTKANACKDHIYMLIE